MPCCKKVCDRQKRIARDSFAELDKWRALAGDAASEPTLIYGGSDEYSHNGVKVVGWVKCGSVCDFIFGKM